MLIELSLHRLVRCHLIIEASSAQRAELLAHVPPESLESVQDIRAEEARIWDRSIQWLCRARALERRLHGEAQGSLLTFD